MQPYFLPYIGYFQLIAAVDRFIVYDNIKYTKKGWINRNRMLLNGTDAMFSLPLQSGSDSMPVCERELAPDFKREKLVNQLQGAYRRAPFFSGTMPLLEQIIRFTDENLFRYIHHSICQICKHLEINTGIVVSSSMPIDHELKGQDKVLALCVASQASTYINAIGGTELYSRETFSEQRVALQFIKSKPFEYPQFDNPFVPWLSIVDVLMFNELGTVQDRVFSGFELV